MDSLLVGDHLGQLKRVDLKGEKRVDIAGTGDPVVTIAPMLDDDGKYLIATEKKFIYVYDGPSGKHTSMERDDKLALCKALPLTPDKILMFHEKQVNLFDTTSMTSEPGYLSLGKPAGNILIKNASIMGDNVAVVGKNVPLRVFDIQTKQRIFTANPPEKDYLGISPDIYVTGLDWLGANTSGPVKIVTCSKSDSIIRVYDTKSNPKPVLTVDLSDQTFNEYADTPKFTTITASRVRNTSNQAVIVGSTVGHMIGVDLRFAPSKNKKKSKNHKRLGNLKGSRGGSITDIKFVAEDDCVNKIVSCSLDRYLRIHNFTKSSMAFASRNLENKVYMTTKPTCCYVIYKDPDCEEIG